MIVGICGLAGHGKSTVAGFLAKELGYKKYALASPIKKFFRCLFLWDSEHLYGELKETECITPFISANEIVQALRTAQIPLEEYHVVLNFFAEFKQFVHEESHFDGYPATQYKVSPRRAMQIFGTEVCRSIDENVWLQCAENALNNTENKSLIIEDVRFDNEAEFVHNKGVLVNVVRKDGAAALNHASEQLDPSQWASTTIYNDSGLAILKQKCYDLSLKIAKL